jgi:hypothetical protein
MRTIRFAFALLLIITSTSRSQFPGIITSIDTRTGPRPEAGPTSDEAYKSVWAGVHSSYSVTGDEIQIGAEVLLNSFPIIAETNIAWSMPILGNISPLGLTEVIKDSLINSTEQILKSSDGLFADFYPVYARLGNPVAPHLKMFIGVGAQFNNAPDTAKPDEKRMISYGRLNAGLQVSLPVGIIGDKPPLISIVFQMRRIMSMEKYREVFGEPTTLSPFNFTVTGAIPIITNDLALLIQGKVSPAGKPNWSIGLAFFDKVETGGDGEPKKGKEDPVGTGGGGKGGAGTGSEGTGTGTPENPGTDPGGTPKQ